MKETKYAGTQTEKNLMAAFAGESEARNKYTYFASKAKKEGMRADIEIKRFLRNPINYDLPTYLVDAISPVFYAGSL